MSIADRVKKILADHLYVEPVRVVPEATLMGDLAADSLDLVEVVMELEQQFGIEVPDDVAEGFVTVADAIRYVERQVPETI